MDGSGWIICMLTGYCLLAAAGVNSNSVAMHLGSKTEWRVEFSITVLLFYSYV
jgi:hypothetical protein